VIVGGEARDYRLALEKHRAFRNSVHRGSNRRARRPCLNVWLRHERLIPGRPSPAQSLAISLCSRPTPR
jgi:hypothetical protein